MSSAGLSDVNNTLIPELRDLVTRYKPHYLYADGDWSGSDDFLQTKPFLAWLFNEAPNKDYVVVNDRWGNTTRTHHGGTYLCEYDPTCKFDHPFAVTQGFGKSFGYNRQEEVKTAKYCDWQLQYGDGHCPVSHAVTQADADQCCTTTNTTGLVHLLVRTVSKGGNLEINFGPAADGRLPTAMVQPLLGTGRWLSINGEAIYNTTGFPFGRNVSECSAEVANDSAGVSRCFTAGPDGSIFVIYLHWPTVPVAIDHLANDWSGAATKVTLLGSEGTAITASGGGSTGQPFVFTAPTLSPTLLRCELDLCHGFVFKLQKSSS